jgi:C-terminal processing protease CtpA/Prc
VEKAPIVNIIFSDEGKLGIKWGNAAMITRIKAVKPGSYAATQGVEEGDVLVEIDKHPLVEHITAKEFKALMLGLERPFTLGFRRS